MMSEMIGCEPLPPQVSTGRLVCQVDHLAHHPYGLFGFGWALYRDGEITRAYLHLHYADMASERVDVSMGRAREDVAIAFADYPLATNAGFMFMAGWSSSPPLRVELAFVLSDGRLFTQDLHVETAQAMPRTERSGYRYLLRRAWAYLRQGKLSLLWRKVTQYRRSSSRLSNGDALQLKGRRCHVVIDHSMGGGANQIREAGIADWLARGDAVVLVSFRVFSMSTYIEVRDGPEAYVLPVTELDSLGSVLASAQIEQIVFNCGVSFPRPMQLQQFVMALKRNSSARLLVMVHEYFLACPSAFLLNDQGRFCSVPEIAECDRCLRAHGDGFVSLTGEREIQRWRMLWGEMLTVADEIRCFSVSSRQLLARAYPAVVAQVSVVPHKVEPLRAVRNNRSESPYVTVGVIGAISLHKGAQVITDLAQAILEYAAPIRIVVIGTLDAWCPGEVVKQTGFYRREELSRLLEKHNINMLLMPSICPETFSFVTHEIISTGLPWMCFDLGAQGDLARKQSNARVAMHQDGSGLLDEILAFDRYLHPLSLRMSS
jgi:hypothetical protein